MQKIACPLENPFMTVWLLYGTGASMTMFFHLLSMPMNSFILLLALLLAAPSADAKPVRILSARGRRMNAIEAKKSLVRAKLQPRPPLATLIETKKEEPLLTGLDPHSAGIGVNLITKEGLPVINDVYAGSSAAKTGLQKGDVIVAVNGKQTGSLGLYQVKAMLMGKRGSTIEVAYRRKDEQHFVSLVLDFIDQNGIRIYESENIPVVTIFDFNAFVDGNMRSLLLPVAQKEPKAIIVDLRNNAGGRETSMGKFMSLFLRKGTTYGRIDYASPKRSGSGDVYTEYKVTADQPIFPLQTKVIVLINKNAWGISEMITAALQEASRAVIVGESTPGIVTLVSGSDGELFGTFATSAGKVIAKIGVQPDISITDDQEISDQIFLKGMQLAK